MGGIVEYLIFYRNNFDRLRERINNFYKLPKDGYKNGKYNNELRTLDYVLPKKHPKENKYFLPNRDLPKFVKEECDEVLSESEIISGGWKCNEFN